jgi:hypothetical protein
MEVLMRETEEMEQRDRFLGGVRTSCALREMVGLGEVGGELCCVGWLMKVFSGLAPSEPPPDFEKF